MSYEVKRTRIIRYGLPYFLVTLSDCGECLIFDHERAERDGILVNGFIARKYRDDELEK